MRIAILVSRLSPWAWPICRLLKAEGHEVHIIDYKVTREGGYLGALNENFRREIEELSTSLDGVHELYSNQSGLIRYVLAVPQFRRILKAIKADVVLSLYGGGQGLLAYLSCFRPYIIYAMGSDILLQDAMRQRMNRITLKAAAHNFANGIFLNERLLAQAPGATSEALLHGIHLDVLQAARFDASPIRVICTRGFADVYNNEQIIRAVKLLPPDLPDFRVTFVAPGPNLESCRALAEGSERMEFVGGMSHDALVKELESCQIYVSMSRSDGTSTSLLEALGCGLYPILSDIPPNRDWVKADGSNGRRVPLDDDQALADALEFSIRNLDQCARASELNRAEVFARADATKNIPYLAKALEKIVRG